MNNIVPSVILLMGESLAIIRNYNHIGLFFANQHFLMQMKFLICFSVSFC